MKRLWLVLMLLTAAGCDYHDHNYPRPTGVYEPWEVLTAYKNPPKSK